MIDGGEGIKVDNLGYETALSAISSVCRLSRRESSRNALEQAETSGSGVPYFKLVTSRLRDKIFGITMFRLSAELQFARASSPFM